MIKSNMGILTFPMGKAGNKPLSNLVDILCPISNDTYLITGNEMYDFFKENEKVHTYGIMHKSGENVTTRILKFIYTQLRMSYKLAKISGNVDIWVFFIGCDVLIIPMLIAKLLGKKVILALPGSSIQGFEASKGNLLRAVKSLSKINFTLSNGIIIYSENLIKKWSLEKYKNKIHVAKEHFLDFKEFKIKKKFNERDNLVGYIGRLSKEKGILNFVESIPEILREKKDLKFLIGGDGLLRDKINKYLSENDLTNKVRYLGWIPHDKLPDYLNELKLLVLPSYTEGLPNILLEAMACGTPVLANPVGAIPDIIGDGETGFVMENNTPNFIAVNVVRALNCTSLKEIVKNARALVENEFTYEVAVNRYKNIIADLSERAK